MTAGALVKALALLDVLEQHGNPEIAILKMDAEGVEADLLEDLKDAGYLNRIWWIRGEWHYDLSVSRIQSALEKTHVCNTARSVCGGWGPLIATENSEVRVAVKHRIRLGKHIWRVRWFRHGIAEI